MLAGIRKLGLWLLSSASSVGNRSLPMASYRVPVESGNSYGKDDGTGKNMDLSLSLSLDDSRIKNEKGDQQKGTSQDCYGVAPPPHRHCCYGCCYGYCPSTTQKGDQQKASSLATLLGFSLAWKVVLATQLFCWTAQFIGHGIFEKQAPALLDSLAQAFLMGPFFVLLEALQTFFGYEPYPGFHAKVKAKVDANIKEWKESKQKKSS